MKITIKTINLSDDKTADAADKAAKDGAAKPEAAAAKDSGDGWELTGN